MSARTSKKATIKLPKLSAEPIITRTKSAQQKRKLRNTEKKTEKPKLTKQEQKSPKPNKKSICLKASLLKKPVTELVEVVEQVEYYPNKLKRDVCSKKIMLKPKHNFKVIATTNKRKLAIPRKGIKSPTPSQKSKNSSRSLLKAENKGKTSAKACSSPELSMQDMVRIMEETNSLSDEDFMEILTCPSPVWWEDPPDSNYDEDSIYTISPDPEKLNKDNKTKHSTNVSINTNKNLPKSEQKTNKQTNVNSDKFINKKQKLENVLGKLKKTNAFKKTVSKNVPKNNIFDRYRKVSDSEGDISDLSFNEEEILNNLENMDIPIEKPIDPKKELNDFEKEIKEEICIKNEDAIKKEKEETEQSPTLIPNTEIKTELPVENTVFDAYSATSVHMKFKDGRSGEMNSNTQKKYKDIVITNSCKHSSIISNSKESNDLVNVDSSFSEIVNISPNEQNCKNQNSITDKNDLITNKKTNDLSEYITVYKIIPENKNDAKNPQNSIKSNENHNIQCKVDASRGTLNNFFKQCKSNKRLKKNETSSPADPMTAVKEEIIDLDDEKNRLKPCDYCVQQIESGTMNFSCEECELAPILPCDLCNFVADTREIYRKHVSSCKEVARISWNHNYLLNQT